MRRIPNLEFEVEIEEMQAWIILLEHFSNTIFPWDRIIDVHFAPFPHQWSHLFNLVIKPKESTCVYEEDISPFPLRGILSHVLNHSISSFSTKMKAEPKQNIMWTKFPLIKL